MDSRWNVAENLGLLLRDPRAALRRWRRGRIVHSVQDWARERFLPVDAERCVNEREIRVIGLRRSGNHAIALWIRAQALACGQGAVFFLNNLPVGENPFRHRYEYPEDTEESAKSELLKPESRGEFSQKAALIYSYEDHSLVAATSERFERRRLLYLGRSRHQFDILILRDPFNLFASRMRSEKVAVKVDECSMVDLWIEHAREFLGETSYLPRRVSVDYNRWFADVGYRRNLAERLNFSLAQDGIGGISRYGGGSSFDVDPASAESLDVLNRWRRYADDPTYRALFERPEIFDYSERIFGSIPGTEILRR